ncbi:MAG: prepilin-type N-terminal cleavage/methylation domain-containing protein [Desulfotomaculaceae bacterium]|nr:prepilin-type N-terminal cleavage/methylation domain-containing protein [Desulfotomaculaceae bacterium]
MIRRLLRNDKGFTMVEMMVVMIIIAVLVAGGVKFYQGYIENAKVTKAKAQISTMQAALDTYYAENGAYPFSDKTDDFKAQMLNAGLVVSLDGTLDVADPWGASSYYKYNSSAEGKDFYIRSGWDTVQGQDDPTVVYGEGSNGTSKVPVVKKISEI